MKRGLAILVLISSMVLNLSAQDTVWLDKNINASTEEKASYYRVLTKHPPDSIQATERTYFKTGQIRSERHFSSYPDKVVNGRVSEWYEDGTPKKEVGYLYGEWHGYIKTFWPNGKKRREDQYEAGKFLIGHCYDSLENEITHFPYFIPPEAKVKDSLSAFVQKNLKYPEAEKKKGLNDTVLVAAIIKTDGSVVSYTIIDSGASQAVDEEALRVINLIPGWQPAKLDGEPILSGTEIPVVFTP